MFVVIAGLSITQHSHDVWERSTGAVVLVCIEENAQAFELVFGSKNRAGGGTLFREPKGKSIAVEVA
jgi:hypothetical protein